MSGAVQKIFDPLDLTGKAFGLFGGGSKTPAPAPASAAPTIDNRAVQSAADEEARKRANAGRASTVLAGEEAAPSAQRVLLGAGGV
jgi:hypothetical protein